MTRIANDNLRNIQCDLRTTKMADQTKNAISSTASVSKRKRQSFGSKKRKKVFSGVPYWKATAGHVRLAFIFCFLRSFDRILSELSVEYMNTLINSRIEELSPDSRSYLQA